jgi:5-methylcytosine-specific restriction protein A
MALSDLTSRAAVEAAVAEFDDLGQAAFLAKYGFARARSYYLRIDDRDYDSKPIIAVAHGIQFPELGFLQASEFSGGQASVAKKLEDLGFEVHKPTPNPDWTADELIVVLDLYVRRGILSSKDPELIATSELLNALPIHSIRSDRFRNANGVKLKLANFAALDPDYPGVGMRRGSKRDAEVWNRFYGRWDELHEITELIRSAGTVGDSFPAVPEEDEDSVEEGRLLYRRHRTRERDRKLVERKKAAALKQLGRLECEVCAFDFHATYGELGHGYIECHHTVPLAQSGATTTRLADLALLCANCHRMIHRKRPFASVPELQAQLKI